MAATASAPHSAIGPSSASVVSANNSFRFPPIHAFPPFYTLQHNPVSRGQQLSQWRTLILDYCRHHRIFTLSALASSDLSFASNEAADPHKSLFANRSIQRSLSSESIRQVLGDLVDHKQAAWEDASVAKKGAAGNAKVFVHWKTPVQWGDAIYDWVMATGQNKSIMTLFELNQGELVQGQDFYELPTPMLRQALKHLSTQGKAQIFAGSEAEDGEGVKFV
ncbi:related to VPS25-vacuolar protein sorting [Sporisorium reilianum SRZ2]|uniref:ESCRT-II complex subunit VPS25 n=1 Tax=Sporisorium reilianum (strain SRZ2) TaxID=999809 RepID=E6ZMP1_SPORE|nr:related to VPS25-vacuolar protein sorting [Sporisorium reilianum SRZ2]